MPPATVARFLPNYPNPFNPATTIGFFLERPERVRIDIFDVRGGHVANLTDRRYEAGKFFVAWPKRRSSSSSGRARTEPGNHSQKDATTAARARIIVSPFKREGRTPFGTRLQRAALAVSILLCLLKVSSALLFLQLTDSS